MSSFQENAEYFLLRQWPYSKDVCLVALLCTGCLRTRKANPNKTWHPVHDFLHTFLTTSASGIMGPLLVGEMVNPLVNDAIITYFILIWFIFYRLDKYLVPFFCTPGILQVLVILTTLSRGNNICIFTDKAFKRAIKFSSLSIIYPIPLLGPIIVGMVRGSGGLYFPPDKGIGGFKNGFPFNAQIALFSATVWHLLMNDTYVLGNTAREIVSTIFGEVALKPELIKCCLIFFVVLMNVIQSFSKYKSANPFYPLWEVVYFITGVQRSKAP